MRLSLSLRLWRTALRASVIDFQNNTITIRHTVTSCNLDGKHIQIAQDTTKTKSSMRTLPLVPAFKEKLLKLKEQQEEYRRVCGRCYNKKYLEYICVDEMGTLISPHYLTASFPKLLEKNNLRHIRFHDLRHPYVKHTTKKYNSEKQKTQATKIDLIAWVFCFCIISYSKEVMDLVNNLNAVVGKDTHLFNQQIGQLGG